jgi:hypothetical protein
MSYLGKLTFQETDPLAGGVIGSSRSQPKTKPQWTCSRSGPEGSSSVSNAVSAPAENDGPAPVNEH